MDRDEHIKRIATGDLSQLLYAETVSLGVNSGFGFARTKLLPNSDIFLNFGNFYVLNLGIPELIKHSPTRYKKEVANSWPYVYLVLGYNGEKPVANLWFVAYQLVYMLKMHHIDAIHADSYYMVW